MTSLHDTSVRGFASDNYSGIHPEVLAAITAANDGHQTAYGSDVYTARLQELVAEHFGDGAEAFPVFNGTGANVTALQSMLPRWGAVIAASTAHINVDEGGAPERVGGIKILTVPTGDGKLTPELIDREAWGWGDEHRAQPLVVSITQSTELGTLYTPDELRTIDAALVRGDRAVAVARSRRDDVEHGRSFGGQVRRSQPTVVLQRAEHRVDALLVAARAERARGVGAQVVAAAAAGPGQELLVGLPAKALHGDE